jgi:hypothetical protein
VHYGEPDISAGEPNSSAGGARANTNVVVGWQGNSYEGVPGFKVCAKSTRKLFKERIEYFCDVLWL